MMETVCSITYLLSLYQIYPSKVPSVFVDPKLQLLLDKEARKKNLHLDDLNADEEVIDGDMDSELDRCVKFVFDVYATDKKNPNSIPKKSGEQFFKVKINLISSILTMRRTALNCMPCAKIHQKSQKMLSQKELIRKKLLQTVTTACPITSNFLILWPHVPNLLQLKPSTILTI